MASQLAMVTTVTALVWVVGLQICGASAQVALDAERNITEQRHLDTHNDPIFIVGCGHSGTSIMLRLIGQHPRIYMFDVETCALCRIGRGLEDDEVSLDEEELARKRLAKLDAQFNAEKTEQETRWVEKTPLHVRYIDKIFKMRPRAKVILMIRDGRDVVASFKGRARPENAARAVRDGTSRWIHDTALAFRAQFMYNRVLMVPYEHLIKNTSTQLKRMFEFVNEEYDENQILSFYRDRRPFNGLDVAGNSTFNDTSTDHEHLRASQFNSPLYDGTGRHLLPPPRGLSSTDWNVIDRVEGFQDLMRKLGYTS